MAMLPIPEFRPDVSDLNAGYTRILKNVVPRDDGYGPFKSLEAYSEALPATCRGYFAARNTDGTVSIFAGTSTKLYQLDNTTLDWTDVSKASGTYTTLGDGAQWSFCQFGTRVIACQANDAVQSFVLGSSTEFADLGGSPPDAGWCAVVGPFVVLADLASDPYLIHWSAINDPTGWTAGTDRSDTQSLPDLGRIRCVREMAADVGLIMQEEGARRMIYQPGSAVVFRIDRLPDVPGILSPYSLCATQGGAYYFSTRGFVRVTSDGALTPIGEERINRAVLGRTSGNVPDEVAAMAYDPGHTDNMIGAVDPKRSVIIWTYKSASSGGTVSDRAIIYHTTLNRFAQAVFNSQFIAATAQPGITLEGLDKIAPGYTLVSNAAGAGAGTAAGEAVGLLLALTGAGGAGGEIRLTVGSTTGWNTGDYATIKEVGGTTEANATWEITVIDSTTLDLNGSTFSNAYTSGGYVAGRVDELTISFDDISTATLPSIAAFDDTNKLSFFTGTALEAVLETAEQALMTKRTLINGLTPVTDSDDVYALIVSRDKLNDTSPTEGTENSMNDDGFIPLLDEGRYVRARIRIPAATEWGFISGVEPEALPGGQY